MTYARAIRIARVLLEREIARLAPQANLAEHYGCDSPACVGAAERRRELREAIETLGQGKML